jgi:3-methylfumaryl-CoA hydratase
MSEQTAKKEFQDWIGRSQSREAMLDSWPAQALRATLGGVPEEEQNLPCLWHWLYFLETAPRDQIGVDGHPKRGGFLPPIALPRRMFAGGRTTILKPLVLGRSATLTETILKVEQKRGGDDPLILMTLGFAYTQDNELCIREERDIVYLGGRPAPQPLDSAIQPLEETRPWRADVTPDPVMLMRFSALTFNGHRIHYDTDYAQREEGYPERVVHGPLTATLLAELVRHHAPGAIHSFSFRAQSPLFVNAPLRLRAGLQEDGTATAIAYTPSGKPAMTASVTVG